MLFIDLSSYSSSSKALHGSEIWISSIPLNFQKKCSVQNLTRVIAQGTMVAGWDLSGPALYYVDSEGQRTKGKVFSVGSGSLYAYGVLDNGYKWYVILRPYWILTSKPCVISLGIASSLWYDNLLAILELRCFNSILKAENSFFTAGILLPYCDQSVLTLLVSFIQHFYGCLDSDCVFLLKATFASNITVYIYLHLIT